jgi:hypothetical protein
MSCLSYGLRGMASRSLRRYWLRGCRTRPEAKARRMKKNPFVFLRATFFRWAGTIDSLGLCSDLANAPTALSIGDAHIENFGTWRDDEGRLVWGANDFDEASEIPIPSTWCVSRPARGWPHAEGVANPRPVVLDERHMWLRELVACPDDRRAKFWREIDALTSAKPPRFVRDALTKALPKGTLSGL